jgi:hypothetical protein
MTTKLLWATLLTRPWTQLRDAFSAFGTVSARRSCSIRMTGQSRASLRGVRNDEDARRAIRSSTAPRSTAATSTSTRRASAAAAAGAASAAAAVAWLRRGGGGVAGGATARARRSGRRWARALVNSVGGSARRARGPTLRPALPGQPRGRWAPDGDLRDLDLFAPLRAAVAAAGYRIPTPPGPGDPTALDGPTCSAARRRVRKTAAFACLSPARRSRRRTVAASARARPHADAELAAQIAESFGVSGRQLKWAHGESSAASTTSRRSRSSRAGVDVLARPGAACSI